MDKLDIPVILGSIRRGRNTPRLARFLNRQLAEDERFRSELIDLAELDLPMLEERIRFLENPPEALVRFGESMQRADGVLIVTPEYNKTSPAALKNALDALGSELRRKAVGIATHSVGAFGGGVALQLLRPVLMNLGAVPIPAQMTIPHIAQAFDERGEAADEEFVERAGRFIDELGWYAAALKAHRERG